MIRIRPKAGEREALARAATGAPDRRRRDRRRAVPMADRGRRRRRIAGDLGVHRASGHLRPRGRSG